jgi:transposase
LITALFTRAKLHSIPGKIALLFLPPYSPELNHAEKVWWMIKRELKMKLFKTIEELQQALSTAVEKVCTQPAIKQLTAYSYYRIII